MSAGGFQMRVQPAVWVTLLLVLAAFAALHVAEPYIQPAPRIEDPSYPLFGKRTSLDATFVLLRKWIEGVEVQYTARYNDPEVVLQVADRYKQLRHSDCAVTLIVSDATNESPDHEVSYDLHDIQGGIRAVKMNYDGVEVWRIPLHTIGSRPLIHDRSGATNYTFLATSDGVIARQIANAFDHAVGLCSKMKAAGKPPSARGEGGEPGGAVMR